MTAELRDLLWDRQRGAARPYCQPRASWRAGLDTARPWGTQYIADSPHLGCTPVRGRGGVRGGGVGGGV